MKLSENSDPQVEFYILVHGVDLCNVHDMSLRKKQMVQKDAASAYLTAFACVHLCAQMDIIAACAFLEKSSKTVNINIS